MKTLRERLMWAMGREKIRQAELARRLKITRGAVSLWLDGTTKSLEGENLTRAAGALGVNPHWLATGEGKPDVTTGKRGQEETIRDLMSTFDQAYLGADKGVQQAVRELLTRYDVNPTEGKRIAKALKVLLQK